MLMGQHKSHTTGCSWRARSCTMPNHQNKHPAVHCSQECVSGSKYKDATWSKSLWLYVSLRLCRSSKCLKPCDNSTQHRPMNRFPYGQNIRQGVTQVSIFQGTQTKQHQCWRQSWWWEHWLLSSPWRWGGACAIASLPERYPYDIWNCYRDIPKYLVLLIITTIMIL